MPNTSGGGVTPSRGTTSLPARDPSRVPAANRVTIVAVAVVLSTVLAILPGDRPLDRARVTSALGHDVPPSGLLVTTPEPPDPVNRVAGPLADEAEGTAEDATRLRLAVLDSIVPERFVSAPVGIAPDATVALRSAPPILGGDAWQGRIVEQWRVDPNISWYGPGFYGRRTACGLALTTSLIGVAHRTLPCGTRITFRYRGRVVTAPVVDRGPYVPGRQWDMTGALCRALGHCFTGSIEYRIP